LAIKTIYLHPTGFSAESQDRRHF